MTATTETNITPKEFHFEFTSIKTKLMFIIIMILIIGGMALTGLSGFMASNALTSSTILLNISDPSLTKFVEE